MKKTDKENLEFIKSTLEPFNEKVKLPTEIAENATVALVAGKEQSGKKAGKKRLVRRLSAAAAALIVLIGAGAFVNSYRSPAVKQIPSVIADAEFALSGNDEQVFVDYFTALKADYEDNRKGFDFIINSFGAKMEAAADGVLYETDTFADEEMAEAVVGANSATGTADNADFGTTNTQYADVDEDDIIKNDGKYIYILNSRTVSIVDAENMELASKTDVRSSTTTGTEGMYLYGETLAVICTDVDEEAKTKIILYDISDRKNPVKTNEFSQDGNYFSSRLVDGRVILISEYHVPLGEIEIRDGYAKYNDIVPETETNGEAQTLSSQMITILPQDDSHSTTYVVMTTVDLENPEFEPKTSAILGNGREVYCTSQSLYIIANYYRYEESIFGTAVSTADSGTVIHRFTFENGIIEADGSGEVEGYILNQFSLDEKDGYIRIATHLTESNQITVLDENLKQVAKIENIAPGETIQSVRYIGDYGYVVTFLQTDPLFVIDFTDMENPKIVGELKIPGFSSYLHPFNGYLVGIGTDGDEDGETNAIKISLFDISDPTNPQEIDRFIIKNAYAQTNHKTVMDCSHKDILGFIYTEYAPMLGYTDTKLCTLKIKDGKIEPIGSYSNSYDTEQKQAAEYTPDGEVTFYYSNESYVNGAVKRATYIGDTLYTVSSNRICSYPLQGGRMIEMLDF